MNYETIDKCSVSNGLGIRVVLWVSGCSIHCYRCHNPQTWDFDGGYEFTQDTMDNIIKALNANGVQRNFCVMGGEPLHPNNLFLTNLVINEVRKKYPDIKIYLWTGYLYKDLIDKQEKLLQNIFDNIDVLIDGPYIQEQRDITLPMRGSKNQSIITLHKR